MGRYLIHRFFEGFITLFFLILLCYTMIRIVPGSPLSSDLRVSDAIRTQVLQYYHFDQSLPEQLWGYLQNLLRGDLGPSFYFQGQNVQQVIGSTFPITFTLGFFALVLAVILGFVFAIILSINKNSHSGRFLSLSLTAVISMPVFFIAPLLIYFLALQWNLLPAALLETPSSWILPVVTLSLKPMANIALLVHHWIEENMNLDYVRTVKAKGFSLHYALRRHVIKNVMVSFLGYLTPIAASLLTGSFIVEIIFGIPGMSYYFVTAILERDYPLITGITLTFGFILISLQFIFDLLIYRLDPRVGK